MIGGRNIKKFVKNVLEFLLTDKLAKKYTWTGIRNTNKVKDMKFISLIKGVCFLNYRLSSQYEKVDEIVNKSRVDYLSISVTIHGTLSLCLAWHVDNHFVDIVKELFS